MFATKSLSEAESAVESCNGVAGPSVEPVTTIIPEGHPIIVDEFFTVTAIDLESNRAVYFNFSTGQFEALND